MARPATRYLTRPFDYEHDDLLKLLDDIDSYPPRAGAIMAAALIDDTLRWSIEGFLADDLTDDDRKALFETEGAPMYSFHGKILIGHAFGIYGPVARADLLAIKRIRNAFAHAPRSIDFGTAEIVSECSRLRYFEAARENVSRSVLPIDTPAPTDAKTLFFQTVRVLHLDLHIIASEHSEQLGGMP